MIPGMDPRMMKQAMKKLGMKQEELEATEVIIKTADTQYVFSQPSVARVNMMGQDTWQITGDFEESELSSEVEINEDDVQTVVSQTGVTEDAAREAISKNNGDLAATIMELSKEE